MMNTQRILVPYQLEEFCLFDGSVDANIQALEDIKRRYPEQSVNLRIESYGYDGAYTVCVMGQRLENDAEYMYRLENERRKQVQADKAAARKMKKDRELYMKLKEQFGE